MRPKRILFVDNEPLKVGAIMRLLADAGYQITPIQDIEKARIALAEQWWHLAVLDIRLIDEDNLRDFSGLELAAEADRAIPKLMLTAYPTVEAVREALRAAPGELPPAVDFVSKQDDLGTILDTIKTAVEHRAGINWDLEVDFDGPTTFLSMADWLRARGPKTLQARSVVDLAHELADLWAKLFATQKRITIFPSPQGRSNALVSRVKPYARGPQSLVVVKVGSRDLIEQEGRNYAEFVAPYAGTSATYRLYIQRTLHFAAIGYSLVGSQLEDTKRFADFYREQDSQALIGVVQHLFGQVCAPWYNSLLLQDTKAHLDVIYREKMGLARGEKPDRLDKRVRELADSALVLGFAAKSRGSNVHFEWEGGLKLDLHTLKNWIYETPQAIKDETPLKSVPMSPTHGDMNANNILIDRHGSAWLIDFGQTGYGYRFRDFAELESVIALDLRRSPSFHSLLRFERLLCSQVRWQDGLKLPEDQSTGLDEPELIKALTVIKEMRWIARRWEKEGGDLRRYYLALLFEAVFRIVTDGRDSIAQPAPLWRRAHALLRVATLIETLSQQ